MRNVLDCFDGRLDPEVVVNRHLKKVAVDGGELRPGHLRARKPAWASRSDGTGRGSPGHLRARKPA